MADSLAAPLAGVALAAGAGTRLRPLTLERPKPLCPVGGRALLDWSLEHLEGCVGPGAVAVNAHHMADQIVEHLDRRVGHPATHLSLEQRPLGTAGAIGQLRSWLDGRSALVLNADTWHRADLAAFAAGWDGERVRVLSTGASPFGPSSGVVASIVPWSIVSGLEPEPSGLWERVWRAELAAGRLDAVVHDGPVVDCATPAHYLRANLAWSGGEPVLGSGVVVEGSVRRSVLWPGTRVERHEHLVDAVRTPLRTVLIR
jgi:NDP-sugar pyrophosphorylase family protein